MATSWIWQVVFILFVVGSGKPVNKYVNTAHFHPKEKLKTRLISLEAPKTTYHPTISRTAWIYRVVSTPVGILLY